MANSLFGGLRVSDLISVTTDLNHGYYFNNEPLTSSDPYWFQSEIERIVRNIAYTVESHTGYSTMTARVRTGRELEYLLGKDLEIQCVIESGGPLTQGTYEYAQAQSHCYNAIRTEVETLMRTEYQQKEQELRDPNSQFWGRYGRSPSIWSRPSMEEAWLKPARITPEPAPVLEPKNSEQMSLWEDV